MKIGILTFSAAYNYGAVLQAFALRRYISSLSPDNYVFILNYVPAYLKSRYKEPNILSIMKHSSFHNYPRVWKCYKDIRKKNKAFNKFRQEFFNYGNVGGSYDYILLGSDQIWNKKLTNNCLDKYFWGNVYYNHSNVVSYAVSYGDSIDSNDFSQIKYNLSQIKNISVREKQSAKVLKEICNRNISVVLDPVFLLEPKEWESMCKAKNRKNLIFIYYFGFDSQLFSTIENYAKLNDCEVVYTTTGYCNHPKFDNTISPEDFLSYIKEAKLVITNSFHATAFSLIFNTSCLSVKRTDGNNLRITNLLDLSNSMDTFFEATEITANIIKSKIGSTNGAYLNLKDYINESKKYLSDIFK